LFKAAAPTAAAPPAAADPKALQDSTTIDPSVIQTTDDGRFKKNKIKRHRIINFIPSRSDWFKGCDRIEGREHKGWPGITLI
jgi:hypothetical protein